MAEDINKSAQDFSSEMGSISTHMKYINNSLGKMGNQLDAGSNAMRLTAKAAQDISTSLSENKGLMDDILKGEVDLNKVKELQKEAMVKQNKLQQRRDYLAKKIANFGSKADKAKMKSIDKQMKKAQDAAKFESKNLKKAAEQAAKGESRVSKGLSGMAGKMNSWGLKGVGEHFEKMAVSARKSKQEGGGLAKVVDKKLVGGLEKFGKMNWFGMLIGALVEAAKAATQLDHEIVQIQRNMGLAREEAGAVRQHFVNLEADAGNLLIRTKQITETNNAFQDSLGTSASMISGDIIVGMTEMTKLMHISEESAIGFGKAALASQKSVRQLKLDSIDGALATEKEFGVRVDLKKVIESTGKVSGQIRGIYGNNFELLSKTVAKAQLLGMTLQDVAASSQQMLNFQSSIESEMKAELFLGRKLNLEQARLAALTGDHATYMEEIRKNAGDFVDFSQMNVLQQKALADSLGMSTDQLADMLLQQADLNALKEKARDIGAEDAEQRLQEVSTQEAMNAAMDKLKNIFVNLMAKIEEFEVSGLMGRLLGVEKGTKIFAGLTDAAQGASAEASELNRDMSIYDDASVLGASIPVNDFSLGGLKLKTHPLDTFSLVGGSALDGTKAHTPPPQQQNTGGTYVVKQEKWDTAKFNMDTTKYNY